MLEGYLKHKRAQLEKGSAPPLIGRFYHSGEWHPLRGKIYFDDGPIVACTVVPIRVPEGTEKVDIECFGTPIRVDPNAGELRIPHLPQGE